MNRVRVGWLTLAAYFCEAALRSESSDEHLRYLIPSETFEQASAKSRAAMLPALCNGTVHGNVCDTCPQADAPDGRFTLQHVILGHFLQPNSNDAFVTISGCEQMHATMLIRFMTDSFATYLSVSGCANVASPRLLPALALLLGSLAVPTGR